MCVRRREWWNCCCSDLLGESNVAILVGRGMLDFAACLLWW